MYIYPPLYIKGVGTKSRNVTSIEISVKVSACYNKQSMSTRPVPTRGLSLLSSAPTGALSESEHNMLVALGHSVAANRVQLQQLQTSVNSLTTKVNECCELMHLTHKSRKTKVSDEGPVYTNLIPEYGKDEGPVYKNLIPEYGKDEGPVYQNLVPEYGKDYD